MCVFPFVCLRNGLDPVFLSCSPASLPSASRDVCLCVVLVFMHNEVKKQVCDACPSARFLLAQACFSCSNEARQYSQHCLSAQGAVLQGALQANSFMCRAARLLGRIM